MTEVQEANRKYSVVLSDDHRIVRHAIKTILESSNIFRVAGEAQTADETIELIDQCRPDFLILDIGLPGKSGIEVIYELKERNIKCNIAVLTMFEDEAKILQAMVAGAHAYLLKNSAPEEFLEALNLVLKGEVYIPQRFMHLLEKIQNPPGSKALEEATDPLGKLSKREREVFYLLAAGVPNRHIAKKLFISARTVETHRARIIKKLEFSSTADLIRYAIRYNLLTL